jgi:regulator of protease activity HflC (stomatin/prohibitin superfamily)
MDYLVAVIVFLLLLFCIITIRRTVIFEYQRGLLYMRGRFIKIWGPGEHWYYSPLQSVFKMDIRTFHVTIPGQEILTADNVGIKISLAAGYKVVDPHLAIDQVVNYQEALYLLLQLALRDLVGEINVEDLLQKRNETVKLLFEKTAGKAAELGIELQMVNIKDIMFPGELKNIFAQVVNARKEGLATLERARGESAALRNLANSADLIDKNPGLWQLRLLQGLERSSGNTIVLMPADGLPALKKVETKK